jgi:DNA-binding NtrC family response regulator
MAQRLAMLAEKTEIVAADLGLPAAPVTLHKPTIATPLVAPARESPSRLGAGALHANGLTFDFEHGTHRVEDVERELIIQALRRTRGNVSKAAKLIGMQRSSLRYRIDRFGLQELVQEIASR